MGIARAGDVAYGLGHFHRGLDGVVEGPVEAAFAASRFVHQEPEDLVDLVLGEGELAAIVVRPDFVAEGVEGFEDGYVAELEFDFWVLAIFLGLDHDGFVEAHDQGRGRAKGLVDEF